jgi:hypothetical protein
MKANAPRTSSLTGGAFRRAQGLQDGFHFTGARDVTISLAELRVRFASDTGFTHALAYATVGYPYFSFYPFGQIGEVVIPALLASRIEEFRFFPSPYLWSISAGALPNGLALAEISSANIIDISGTPTVAGDFPFTLALRKDGALEAALDQTLHVREALQIANLEEFNSFIAPAWQNNTTDGVLLAATSVLIPVGAGVGVVCDYLGQSYVPIEETGSPRNNPIYIRLGTPNRLIWAEKNTWLKTDNDPDPRGDYSSLTYDPPGISVAGPATVTII